MLDHSGIIFMSREEEINYNLSFSKKQRDRAVIEHPNDVHWIMFWNKDLNFWLNQMAKERCKQS